LSITDSLSPPRKRQRMSSPTYDEQVDLSQEDIEAFDEIEHALSQLHSQSQLQVRSSSQSQSGMTQPSPSKKGKRLSQSTSLSAKEKRQREIAEALRGVNYYARAGKENLYATDGGRAKKAAPISPSKDIASSQPRFELDSENPFKVLNSSPS
jgi:breast cancer 2 susceptibility protein